MNPNNKDGKVRPEDLMAMDGIKISEKEIIGVSGTYTNFYKWRSYRSGLVRHFRNNSFEDYLKLSRELFWNSISTPSDDLSKLGLDLSLPFARKEVMDILGKISSLQVKPRLVGDNLDSLGIRILQGMYKKWWFKSNGNVEEFWELLYGFVNGTVCSYVGYNNTELQRRYLTSYDPATGDYAIEKKAQKPWNDVSKEIVPIEDIYVPKIFERNIQKQGQLLWKTQMDPDDFHAEFDKYPMAKYVFPGLRIAEDSLYFRLLGGTGTTTGNKIEVMRSYDWISDEFKLIAGGMVLNKLGKGEQMDWSPMPFDHKMAPFTWGIMSPLDEKLAYGLSTSFQAKDPHKILNTAYTMIVERELRAVDPPVLTSDIEAPELIYGQHKTIPVNDVNAYKEMKIGEPSNQFYNMMNGLQGNMRDNTQGGDSAILNSRQPQSAKEVDQDSKLQQQSAANVVTMYYDIMRQQVMLVLKTALQFYTIDKYEGSDKAALRTLLVHDMPMSLGGTGDMEIRIVKEKRTDMALFLEGIKKSIQNGKNTEVVEVPISWLQDLEFQILKIELDPDESTEMEDSSYVDNVITPMISTYVPAGVADIKKVMARHMEKLGESVSDYALDQAAPAQGAQQPGAPANPANPANPTAPAPIANPGQTAGNLNQSATGRKFGMNNVNGKAKALPLIRSKK